MTNRPDPSLQEQDRAIVDAYLRSARGQTMVPGVRQRLHRAIATMREIGAIGRDGRAAVDLQDVDRLAVLITTNLTGSPPPEPPKVLS